MRRLQYIDVTCSVAVICFVVERDKKGENKVGWGEGGNRGGGGQAGGIGLYRPRHAWIDNAALNLRPSQQNYK